MSVVAMAKCLTFRRLKPEELEELSDTSKDTKALIAEFFKCRSSSIPTDDAQVSRRRSRCPLRVHFVCVCRGIPTVGVVWCGWVCWCVL